MHLTGYSIGVHGGQDITSNCPQCSFDPSPAKIPYQWYFAFGKPIQIVTQRGSIITQGLRQHNPCCALTGEIVSLITCQHNLDLCEVPRCASTLEFGTSLFWHHHARRGDHLLTCDRTLMQALWLYCPDRLSAPPLCFFSTQSSLQPGPSFVYGTYSASAVLLL